MPIEVLMPALSPTMEEGNLVKWHVAEGAGVSSGDVIAEIETDKAVMEIEAVDEGVLAKILIAEGTEGVKVNTPIAIILQDGEAIGDMVTSDPVTSDTVTSDTVTGDRSLMAWSLVTPSQVTPSQVTPSL